MCCEYNSVVHYLYSADICVYDNSAILYTFLQLWGEATSLKLVEKHLWSIHSREIWLHMCFSSWIWSYDLRLWCEHHPASTAPFKQSLLGSEDLGRSLWSIAQYNTTTWSFACHAHLLYSRQWQTLLLGMVCVPWQTLNQQCIPHLGSPRVDESP